MKPSIEIKGNTVSVYRERPATASERAKDRDARVMAEWVHITFGTGEPRVTINRDLCA